MSTTTSPQLRSLSREGSLRLLRTGGICSIAVTEKALPVVVAARFALVGDTIYVRARSETLLARAATDRVVGCGVHGMQSGTRRRWTVSITAVAEFGAPTDLATRDELASLRSWGDEEDGQVLLRLATDLVSGQLIEF